MKSSRTLLPRASRRIGGAIAVALVLLFCATARADMPEGKLTQDLTVGANHDIQLKTGQVVQIMNQRGDKTVITVPLPDGSNGIFQINSIAIQAVPAGTPLGLPAPPPPPPPAPGTMPPNYPAAFTGAATFQTTQGSHTGGDACLIKLAGDNQAYLASSRQLLGFQGGFTDQIAAKDVPTAVQQIQLTPYSGAAATYDATGLLIHTNRLKPGGGKPNDDIALFRLPDNAPQAQAAAVALADKPPAIGDIVWLIARLRNSPPDKVAHRAQVLLLNDWVVIQFDDPDILTGGTLGAPVLNTDGQVIGVLSSSLTGGGNVRGYLIPAALLTKTIQSQK
jgi:hypothetical protein